MYKKLSSIDESVKYNFKKMKTNMVDARLKEVEHSIDACSIPTKEYLLNATMKNPVLWDPVESFDRFANQSDSSYNEKWISALEKSQ